MKRIALVCCALLLLAGCVPNVRLNERGVVQAVGIDLDGEGGYRVTMQVRESVGTSAGANQSPESGRNVIVEETGGTMTELFARASANQGRQLFLGSVKVILLGERAARNGVGGVLGFFNSNHQISPGTQVGVVAGEAGEVVRGGEKDPALSADGLQDLLESANKAGYAPRSRLMDVLGAARAENLAGTLTLVSYRAPDPPAREEAVPEEESPGGNSGASSGQENGRENGQAEPEKRLRLAGCAIFSGERMAAALDPEEARGLEWTQNRAKATAISVGDERLGTVAAVTHGREAKITVEMSGDVPVFDIRLKVRSTALESELRAGVFDEKARRYAAALQETKIRGEIEGMVAASLRKGYDLLGLSRLVKQRYPAFYEAHREEWPALLAGCGYNVAVSCEIDRTGVGVGE